MYGLVDQKEIDRTKVFVGYCYSIGKPVDVEKLMIAIQGNTDVLVERGKLMRKESAIVGEHGLATQVLESTGADLQNFEASTEEVDHDSRSGLPPVAEGVRITRGETVPAAPRRSRRKG